MKIGVFDSGRGGKYVADRLTEIFPNDQITYVNDHAHVPYGSRTPDEIRRLTEAAIQPLLQAKNDAIVLACNTATTNAIAYLREVYPETLFVGIEPMVKPAARLTETGVIAVCATPATLTSSNYARLKSLHAKDIEVIEPDCATWAETIELGLSDTIDVAGTIAEVRSKNADVIVLGCTHYHYLKKQFLEAAPDMRILEPTDAIAGHIARSLSTAHSQLQ